MLERVRQIFRKEIPNSSRREVDLSRPAYAERQKALASEAEVNVWFANLKPLTREEATITRNELMDLTHELFPSRKPYQPHLKI